MIKQIITILLLILFTFTHAGENYRWVVKPQFDDARNVFGHSVPVKQGGKWGIISGKTGKWITEPVYEDVGLSRNEHLAVKKNGKWGFIDETGKVVIPIDYDEVQKYDKLIPMRTGNQWRLYNKKGEQIKINSKHFWFENIVGVDDQCIVFKTEDGYSSLYFGKDNIQQSDFTEAKKAFSPSENYIVIIDKDDKYRWIDCKTGKKSDYAYKTMRKVHNERAAVKLNEKWSFHDFSFADIIDTEALRVSKYDKALDFSEGLAPVLNNNKWGYINRNGNLKIPFSFDKAYSFSDGVAGVNVNGKRGFISTSGKYVVSPTFEDYWKHNNGLIPVKFDGLWGIIAINNYKKLGEVNIPLQKIKEMVDSEVVKTRVVLPSQEYQGEGNDIVFPKTLYKLSSDKNTVVAENNLWDIKKKILIRDTGVRNFKAVTVPLYQTKLLLIGESDTLTFRSTGSNRQLFSMQFDSSIKDIKVSPNERYIAIKTDNLIIYDAQDGEFLHKTDGSIDQFDFFNADDSLVVSTDVAINKIKSKSGKLIDSYKPKPCQKLIKDKYPNSSISPQYQDTRAIVENLGFVQLVENYICYQNKLQTFVFKLPGKESAYYDAKFFFTKNKINLFFEKDQEHKVYLEVNLTTEKVKEYVVDMVSNVNFNKNELEFIDVGDKSILFDKKAGKNVSYKHNLISFIDASTSSSNKIIAVGDENSRIFVFDLATGSLKSQISAERKGFFMDTSFALSKDGKRLLYTDIDYNEKTKQSNDSFNEISLESGEIMSKSCSICFELFAKEKDKNKISLSDYENDPNLLRSITNFTNIAYLMEKYKLSGYKSYLLDQNEYIVNISSQNSQIRIFKVSTGELVATAVMSTDGEWVMMTPEGFFNASKNGDKLIGLVKGTKVTTIDQAYDVLYRPDLVIAKLQGDPEGKVKAAAKELNLDILIDSGLPPTVAFDKDNVGTVQESSYKAIATLTDNGGGVGKLEWRVNGVVRHVQQRGLAPIKGQSATAVLSLDPGKNIIELVAYNTAGLIASDPATMQVSYQPAAEQSKPSLYVLAVGINDYADKRLNLNFAEPDAKAIEQAFIRGGKRLFKNVQTQLVLNDQVNKARLEKAFSNIAATMNPEDVFLFFIAGHGKTEDGRYYFIPHDFTYSNAASYKANGIGQEQWQAWFAKIPAQKSVLLYDTCESGSMTKIGERGLASIERDTAIEKLRRATGRTILSATNDDAPAMEGYGGHGIFTYSILEGINSADTNADNQVDLAELITHITQRVPEISKTVFGIEQTPRIQSNGNSFVLSKTVQVLDAKSIQRYPKRATHAVKGGTVIYTQPNRDAPTRFSVKQDMLYTVFVIKTEDNWAMIAKDGKFIGYVQRDTIIPIQ